MTMTRIPYYFTLILLMFFLHASSVRAELIPPLDNGDLRTMIEQAESRIVLLNFWAAWCAPCRKEVPELVKMREKYGDKELTIIGVSLDGDELAAHIFARQHGINYPIFLGDDATAKAFKVNAIPKIMLFNGDHTILEHSGYLPPAKLHELIDNALNNHAQE